MPNFFDKHGLYYIKLKKLLDFMPSRPNYLPINKPKTDSPFIEFIYYQ